MRRAWSALTVSPIRPATGGSPNESDERVATDAEIARITAAHRRRCGREFALSERAKNALDRGSAIRIRDVLSLAENRLSAIRGVGRLVAKEILS